MNRLYLELYEAFSLFNREFFDGSLPEVMITLERNYRIKGYFSPERFIEREEKNGKQLHEIALNPEYFGLLTVPEILSTLFHEMVHLEFYGNDRSQKKGYHSKKWALKMEECGLIPTDTGYKGGKKTGWRITQVIEKGGRFDLFTEEMIRRGFEIEWKDNLAKVEEEPERKKKKRFKYTCSCGLNVWGKKGLKIKCGECNEFYIMNDR